MELYHLELVKAKTFKVLLLMQLSDEKKTWLL